MSVARDLGFVWPLHVRTDSVAAIGVCRRRGLGKLQHLATADLWVQDRLRSGDFTLTKPLGPDIPSDILTTHADRNTLEKHLAALGIRCEEGRAETAPTIDHA